METKIETGIAGLDDAVGFMGPGTLTGIFGRSGAGSTALALAIAHHNAQRRIRVGVLSFGLSAERLVERLQAAHARVSIDALRNGTLTPEEDARLAEAVRSASYPLRMLVCNGDTEADLAKVIETWKSEGIDLAVVHDLGLSWVARDRAANLEHQALLLREASLRHKVSVIATMAVRPPRDSLSGKPWYDYAPTVDDVPLGWDQAADTLLTPFRLAEHGPISAKDSDEAIVSVVKARFGPGGMVPMRWEAHSAAFYSVNEL